MEPEGRYKTKKNKTVVTQGIADSNSSYCCGDEDSATPSAPVAALCVLTMCLLAHCIAILSQTFLIPNCLNNSLYTHADPS